MPEQRRQIKRVGSPQGWQLCLPPCREDTSGGRTKQALEQTALLLEEKEDAIYYRCVLKGCTCLDAKEQREELLRLGIQYRALGEKEGQEEVTQWMAMAYEQNGKRVTLQKCMKNCLQWKGKEQREKNCIAK